MAMSTFLSRLGPHAPTPTAPRRRWLFIPYDQLSTDDALLRDARPADTTLVFVESAAKARRRPYHQQKLVLLLSCQRHFALEMAERGFAIA